MTEGQVTLRRDGPFGFVTLDNEAKRNAMTYAMYQGLARAFDELSADPDVRVILLKGAGRKAFTAGADVSQFAKHSVADMDVAVATTLGALDRITKPIIAVVHGYCIGGGLSLLLRCDLRFADTESRFAMTSAKLGFAWTYRGTRDLTNAVGPALARDLLFTGRTINADEALRAGLVNQVAPPDSLEAAALEHAKLVAANAPLSIASSKLMLREILNGPTPDGMANIEAAINACAESEDGREGQLAFRERRPPRFTGR